MLIDDFQAGNGCLPFIQLACIIKSFNKIQPQHAFHQRICDKIKSEFNVFGCKSLSITPLGIWIKLHSIGLAVCTLHRFRELRQEFKVFRKGQQGIEHKSADEDRSSVCQINRIQCDWRIDHSDINRFFRSGGAGAVLSRSRCIPAS
ncbi:hypothetical protein D3C75_691880 [compost metagenome]